MIFSSVAENVSKRKSAGMNSTNVSIMHAGWTFGVCHYIGLFAIYVRKSQ